MASASNSSSPNSSTPGGDSVEVYVDGRTKGSRGSKRSVTRLSKEQLEKKRQNDRESQRNIRRRNKEKIASLEAKVKELEEQNDPANVEQLKQRNKELEAENERLRSLELEVQSLKRQMQTQIQQPISAAPRIPTTINEVVMSNTTDELPTNWELDAVAQAWNGADLDATMGADPLNMQTSEFKESIMPPLNTTSNPVSLEDPLNSTLSSAFDYVDTGIGDVQQQQLNSALISSWGGAIGSVPPEENLSKSDIGWASIPSALSQPSRFAAPPNVSQPMTSFFENSTCWQRQPSVYAWQISTKIKPPVTFVDQLMIKAIQSQRHIVRTAGMKGEEVIGPYVPNVELLFTGADVTTDPVSKELPLSLTLQETMNLYSTIVSRRGFAFLAEKLASFLAMYRFVRWQIEPTFETYQGLYPWQRPIQSQHEISHPAWMDLPPWPKFRDKIIRNQDRYGTPEFQVDYASNLNVNWPGTALSTVVMENGQIKISKAMEKHLTDINNLTMRKPFGDKYPEFHEVVKIDEI